MKTVFITGATSGIGEQLCRDYASQGFNVVACGRNQQKLNALSSEYPSLTTLSFDVTDNQQINDALTELALTPDIWVLNAGDCEYIEDGKLNSGLIRRVFDVNFMGVVNVIEAIQTRFEKGHQLIVVGSISSEVALPRAEAYGASKAALSYLVRTLQTTLKPKGVSVSLVLPGFVETPLTDKNTFDMPAIVTASQASAAIRQGIEQRKPFIYFPKRFTVLLRIIASLPYQWQSIITAKLIKE
ncbi:SDR family NAD(P)-dependent oxidoreductase [Vibrio intestinalis]|uniref:SDR family NAD(P)-dependent oxidoreductase n=1 Tax=Vibrio intestinalis TaxID=2933291 RepID=UPI0021A27A10|nr:SDR family NAD(P)-dependent oxidoreductase [Vibrio intestinalis]